MSDSSGVETIFKVVPQGSVRGSDQLGRDEIMMAKGEGRVGRGRGRVGDGKQEEGRPDGKDFDGFRHHRISHVTHDQEES